MHMYDTVLHYIILVWLLGKRLIIHYPDTSSIQQLLSLLLCRYKWIASLRCILHTTVNISGSPTQTRFSGVSESHRNRVILRSTAADIYVGIYVYTRVNLEPIRAPFNYIVTCILRVEKVFVEVRSTGCRSYTTFTVVTGW